MAMLNTLCSPSCESSLSSLKSIVDSASAADTFILSNQTMAYDTLVDLYQYEFGLIYLSDSESKEYFSDVEDR